jgi:hypothetical protein
MLKNLLSPADKTSCPVFVCTYVMMQQRACAFNTSPRAPGKNRGVTFRVGGVVDRTHRSLGGSFCGRLLLAETQSAPGDEGEWTSF